MDPIEFKKKIIPLQSVMQRLAERMLDNADDAEDIVQDVFLTLWNRRNELNNVVRLESYCLQIVRTRCIDLIRKRKSTSQHATTIMALTDTEVLMEVEETRQQSDLLYKLLEQLPEKQQKAVQLKYFSNATTEQMETALQMSSANVYTTLSRALQTLREKLRKQQ